MLTYPRISPNIFEIGPLKFTWYGLMYALGFLISYLLITRQLKSNDLEIKKDEIQDLIISLALGLVIGARFGYILFYQFPNLKEYAAHPLEIVAIWHGGMSFHGGLIGTLVAGIIFCRYKRLPFWEVADMVIVTAPIGLGLGRIGNFINGELFGRQSSVPWAMIFPAGGPVSRHPSQLYEFLLEGVLLFILLWSLKNLSFRPGTLVCYFLCGYGFCRFFVEFFREPDPQLGLLVKYFTMGQVLSFLMILISIILWFILSLYFRNEDRFFRK